MVSYYIQDDAITERNTVKRRMLDCVQQEIFDYRSQILWDQPNNDVEEMIWDCIFEDYCPQKGTKRKPEGESQTLFMIDLF